MIARCVWLSEEEMATPLDSAFREVVRAKFQAAPADPAEAIAKVIHLPSTLAYETWWIGENIDRILRALGYEAVV